MRKAHYSRRINHSQTFYKISYHIFVLQVLLFYPLSHGKYFLYAVKCLFHKNKLLTPIIRLFIINCQFIFPSKVCRITLFLIMLLTFTIMHAVPGGPFTNDRKVSPEVEAALNAKYNLDKPLPEQFLGYLKGILHGDLGPSFKYIGKEVSDFIKDYRITAKRNDRKNISFP